MQRSVQAAPEARGLRQSPSRKVLAPLLAAVAIVGLAWALVVPPWQAPDELAHFAYVQSLAESFQLPSAPGRPFESSDLAFADGSVGAGRGAFFPRFSPPDWSRADYGAYLRIEHSPTPPSASNGGGPSSASGNPPLYYLLAAGAYLVDGGGTAFGRLYAVRIFGALLLTLTAWAAWLLAGEVFGRRRPAQLVCAAVAGLLPMGSFISTSVNPDALLMTLWTVALWLGARVLNRGLRRSDAVGLCAVTAAAILTKATSYALVPAVLLALVVGWRRLPGDERGRGLRRLAAAIPVLVVPVLAWLGLARSVGGTTITNVGSSPAHPFNVRQFLSYLWQFYLPRLPFMKPFRTTPGLPVRDIWVEQATGVFGWLDVSLPAWMYSVGAWLTAAIAAASLGLMTRLRPRRHLPLLAFFALALVGLLGLLHVTEYRALIAGGGQFLQGRYLLPLIGLLGLAVGLIVAWIPSRLRPLACGLAVAALLSADVLALISVVRAYYV